MRRAGYLGLSLLLVFFSSRRRHTRFDCDWSSDVCSSDLHQISPAVKVRALDAFGNIAAGFPGAVGIALGSNPGGATLSGTTPVGAVGGIATYLDLSVNKAGTGYTLTASASGVPSVTSTPFDIIPGTATQLAFTVQRSEEGRGGVECRARR